MKKELSFYEFAGIVAPGVVALVGPILVLMGLSGLEKLSKLDLGGLGVLLVLAYVVGHLTQAVGNLIEGAYWYFWGGMPTAWVREGKLLSPKQRERLGGLLESRTGAPTLLQIEEKSWYAVTREVYATVAQAKRAERVDIFNGNYGLNRGIAAAGAVVLAAATLHGGRPWQLLLILGGGTAVAVYRMHRFGVHYARELFVQYLDLRATGLEPAAGGTPKV